MAPISINQGDQHENTWTEDLQCVTKLVGC